MTSQCAFGGRRVAILGSDGRIVIREKDVLDDIALFQPCGATSIAMNDTGDFVAVGSESGAVLIWNVLSHKQEILSSSVSSPVTSVAFIGSTLYSSQSGKIFQWENSNLKESFKFDKKVKITKMTKGSSNTIIAGGRKIKSFSLKTGDECRSYSGHTNQTSVLSANSKFILSAGQDEKSATVWRVDPENENEDTECRLQLTRSSKFGSINGRNVLTVNCGSGSGNQVELFSISKKTKPIKSRRYLNIHDEHGDQVEIFAAQFIDQSEDEKNTKCDVIFGVLGALKWEEIDISGPINLERNVVTKSVTVNGNVTNVTQNGDVTGRRERLANRVTGESSRRKRQESINESDMTMAERLGLTNGEEKDLKAGSVTVILQQALHSRDKKQIGKILTYTDNALIRETVKNVPPQLAPVLMTEISARLQAAPERALATSRWLRTTLQYHSAPLAGASHQALETTRLPLQMRTVAFSRLKELQGKLELAIATAKLSDNDSDGDVGNGPMVNINDLTDLEDHSHSESDWEAEFNNEKGSESGADSEIESKRRKLEI